MYGFPVAGFSDDGYADAPERSVIGFLDGGFLSSHWG